MRQLKHHEQRLLKKVDFLDVSTLDSPASLIRLLRTPLTDPDLQPALIISGNKMPLSVKSRS